MKLMISCLLMIAFGRLQAQELYIFSEPASNMPAKTLGVRVGNYLMPMTAEGRTAYRIDPEVMWGVNKNLMIHGNLYASNMMQSKFRMEGGSLYAKYRFLSNDDIHKHFRMAAFGKLALVNNPYTMQHTEQHLLPDGNGGTVAHDVLVSRSSAEQNLDGNHSGWLAGVIATQLVNKLAISASVASVHRWDNLGGHYKMPGDPSGGLQGTLSAGYLLFPRNYTNYQQTNINLYAEFIGQQSYGQSGYFADAAPGIQFIFNSICRLDIGYRFQMAGNMRRFNEQQWLVRFEYNWLNLFSKNK